MLLLAVAGLTVASTAEAATREPPPGTAVPHHLPADGARAAAAEPATWLVGARPVRRAGRIAARYGADRLSARGAFVVERARAGALARALRAAGLYRFAEPDRRLRRQQAPPGGDDVAATDWRSFLLPPGLVPPALDRAPRVAVIDSAVDVTHADLAGAQVIGDPAVVDAHGTAVASLVGGHANAVGMVGLYPGAPVLSVGASLRTADLVRAIAMAVEADARIINLSLGGPVPSWAMFVEIAYAVSQDVLVVASAGNDHLTVLPDGTVNPVMYPAGFPHVMSVSSMGPSGASSSFSTANGAVDVAAPGESVLAAVPVALDGDGVPDGYQRLHGTSFAAPIVSGAAAWLLAARPGLSVAQAADLLRWTSRDLPPAGWDVNSGYGVIDLPAALAGAAPPEDTIEVNDDIEWVNGRRFKRPEPFLFRSRDRRRRADAVVDSWKDPADVSRIQIRGRSRVRFTLGMPRGADPDLAVFSTRARTIYRRRGRVGASFRGPGRLDRVIVRNPARRAQVAYAVVYSPGVDADRIDAPYRLTVERLRSR